MGLDGQVQKLNETVKWALSRGIAKVVDRLLKGCFDLCFNQSVVNESN